MNRSFLIAVFALISGLTAITAQTSFGITTTYNITATQGEDEYRNLSRRTFADQIMYIGESRSMGLGLSLYHDFDLLFLRAEGIYTREEQSYTVSQFIRSEEGFAQQSGQYVDTRSQMSFPLTAGIQLDGVQLGAGPVVHFTLDDDRAIDATERISYQDRALETGYQIFLGYAINKHVVLSVRYEQSFQTLGNRYRYDNQPMNLGVRPARLDVGLSLYL